MNSSSKHTRRSASALPAWARLREKASELVNADPQLLSKGPDRHLRMSKRIGKVFIDFSRQVVDEEVMKLLVQLAEDASLSDLVRAQFKGEMSNVTENRAALHMAFRSEPPVVPDPFHLTATTQQRKMKRIFLDVRNGTLKGATGRPFRHIVNIGIGGSYLGPALVADALGDPTIDLQFLVETGVRERNHILASVELDSTLFLIVSKSFQTEETLRNATACKQLLASQVGELKSALHFVAVTSNREAALAFGVPEDLILEIPPWVGGRFSVWSSVGLAASIAIGNAQYGEFLTGARKVDQHVLDAPPTENIPFLMALLAIWNSNFLAADSHVVLNYDTRLGLLLPYIQQLEMESNGKTALVGGGISEVPTAQVLWGGVETRSQHSFHQLLHQGSRTFSADLIGVVGQPDSSQQSSQWTLAQLIAQASLFFTGYGDSSISDHKRITGKHGTSILLLDQLDAEALGTLLALYEHKVACLGYLWGVNSFDQWGVEHGKALANRLESAFVGLDQTLNLNPLDRALLHAIIGISSARNRQGCP